MKFSKHLIQEIDALLPQTQCGQCGFAGCEPYATAIVEGIADINQCPPGDEDGIRKIAALLGIEPKSLNTSHGLPKPSAVAMIDENRCIGCTFCVRSCPVDAIVGAAKQMHTVITDECTGCELCVAPCPMDCITMVPVNVLPHSRDGELAVSEMKRKADRARQRYRFRVQRLEQERSDKLTQNAGSSRIQSNTPVRSKENRKHAIVQAALQRAAALRAQANK